jgi:hypothetical protein
LASNSKKRGDKPMTTIKVDNKIICQIGHHTLIFTSQEKYEDFKRRLEYPLVNQ